jgi:hypothetical protein
MGEYKTYHEAARRFINTGKTFIPRTDYGKRCADYIAVNKAVKKLYDELAAQSGQAL